MSLKATADTYIRRGSPNRTQATSTLLRVQEDGDNRTLLRFDPGAITSAVGPGHLVSATLQLYIQMNGNNWGTGGRTVDIHRLTADWTEAGATWNCPQDLQPSDSKADCAVQWEGGSFDPEPTDSVLHTNGLSGWVSFDVTADVAAFLAGTPDLGWLVKKTDETLAGAVDYVSREGTSGENPRLVLLSESPTSDTVAPQLRITAPADPVLVNVPAPAIALAYSDGGSGVNLASLAVAIDGNDLSASCAKNATAAACTPPALAAGSHTLTAALADQAGNRAFVSQTFRLLLGAGPHAIILATTADTTLQANKPDQNLGTKTLLEVRKVGPERSLVRFDPAGLTPLQGGQLVAATLQLYVEANGNNWGKTGRAVLAHLVTAPWSETAATWDCAVDKDPENSQPDCASPWNGGSFAPLPTASVLETNGQTGWISLDVTADVAAFLGGTLNQGWLVKKADETVSGRASYASREGTSGHAPRLTVIFTAQTPDTTPPSITDLRPADGALLATATPTLSGSWSDDLSGVDPASFLLTVDDFDVTSTAVATGAGFTWTPAVPLQDGPHTVDVTVTDRTRNPASGQTSFVTDTLAPVITLTSPPATLGSQPQPLLSSRPPSPMRAPASTSARFG